MHLTGWVAVQGPAILPIDVTGVVAVIMELRQEVKQLREAVEFELQLEAGKQREAP